MSETCGGATRRGVLAAACGVGALTVLSGCATYGETPPSSVAPAAQPPAPAGTPPAAGAAPAGFARVADIPVGGGRIFAAEKVVLTQPVAGTIKAFSVVCTHAGCPVSEIAGGTINCACHGSKFAIADGSVADGPAPRPLPAVAVTVVGEQIALV